METAIRAMSVVTVASLSLACCSPSIDAKATIDSQSQISISSKCRPLLTLVDKAISIVYSEDWNSAKEAEGTPDYVKAKYAPMSKNNGSALRQVMDQLVSGVASVEGFAERKNGVSTLDWALGTSEATYFAIGEAQNAPEGQAGTADRVFGLGYNRDGNGVSGKLQIGCDLKYGLATLKDSITKKMDRAKKIEGTEDVDMPSDFFATETD
ncbi:hypothetical protein FACS1894126_1810 [Alphaproteobacteria bacterium]|nr:hypothetical protein FACS1894126_1810 [Alphaproteobacteria bacterium]